MSELQTDSVESEAIEPAVIENPDDGAELATASESEHSENTEPVEEVESEASKQQTYINKQYGTIKQGERDLATANQELDKFRGEERERLAAQVGNIPPMPTDQFDENYEAELKAHIDGSNAAAVYASQNQTYLQQEQLNQQQVAQAQQIERNKVLQEHGERSTALGIKPEEMVQAENAVLQYGLSNELLTHIAGMEDSPLVIKHLAANAQDGYQLASMSPFAIGSFLEGITAKASALKPKTSSTPAPATNLKGNGVDPESGKYSHIKGAKFE